MKQHYLRSQYKYVQRVVLSEMEFKVDFLISNDCMIMIVLLQTSVLLYK